MTSLKRELYCKEDIESQGQVLNSLKAKQSLGQIGVLYGTNRTANCVALAKVLILSMNGEVFNDILGDKAKMLEGVKVGALNKIRIFQGWERASLSKVITHLDIH